MSGFAAVALPVAMGLQGVSAVAGARAQQQEAATTAAALNFNADVEAERQDLIKTQGLHDERQARRMARLMIGERKAAIAGSGLQLTGQRQDILRQDAFQAELDAVQIRENTKQALRASEQQETIDRFQARQATKQGRVAAGTTLLTGALGATNTFLGARGLG